jgi:Arc/MetJ-type ribon-helix-helix transcriptional regulator
MSKELVKDVETMTKQGKYSSKSEFIRDLIRAKKEYDELVRSVRKSQAQFKAGKVLPARSLAELDNLS